MSGAKASWADGLKGPVRRIAESTDSPLRVLAGPGTGKTFGIMRRVQRLLEEGRDPTRILVCTFTRTAAGDLQRELGALGAAGAEKVQAGTIHGLCFGLLRKAEILSLTGRVPRPLLGFEEKFLIEDLQGTNGEGARALTKRLAAFAAAWARLQSDVPGWPQDAQDKVFLGAIQGWLRFHQAMLIGELVPEGLRFLRENPDSPHRSQFEHVLIDEYQDLNRAEQVLLDRLSAASTVTVVGDEDQSIYSFKYARPEGIAQFDQSHPGTRDEPLDECRHCPKLVVELANELISGNPSRTPRALRPYATNPDGEVLVVQWSGINEEARGIAEIVQRRIGAGVVLPGKVLVLAPRRQIGYGIRDALQSAGVLAHSFFFEEALEGNLKKVGGCAAQQAFALLTLLARPDDRVALRSWCGFGNASLNRRAWAAIRSHSESTGLPPRKVLEYLEGGTLTLAHTAPAVGQFRLLLSRERQLSGLTGSDLLEALFPAASPWAAAVRGISKEFRDCEGPEALLDLIQRGVTQPELPTDVDYVRVMSLHKAKGLTGDLVVVAGCNDGLIPAHAGGAAPAKQQVSLEEQRRLFYVAITRTRQTLVLSTVTRLPRELAYRMRAPVGRGGRQTTAAAPSRFLTEMGSALPPAVRGNSTIL